MNANGMRRLSANRLGNVMLMALTILLGIGLIVAGLVNAVAVATNWAVPAGLVFLGLAVISLGLATRIGANAAYFAGILGLVGVILLLLRYTHML